MTLLLLASCERRAEQGPRVEVTLAVAASLRVVLPELIVVFSKDHDRPNITPVYGASGDLKKRVQDGAPIDGVLFAAAEPIDQLIAAGRVSSSTRRVVAHNRLVLIAPKGARPISWQTLDALAAGEMLAIGNPDSVPAGVYARKALQALGKWDALQGRIMLAHDVAAVLAYARRAEVAAAIVYATELHGIDDVEVLEEASGPWAPRADVVVGVVADSRHAHQAQMFVEFLSTPAAQAILASKGFLRAEQAN